MTSCNKYKKFLYCSSKATPLQVWLGAVCISIISWYSSNSILGYSSVVKILFILLDLFSPPFLSSPFPFPYLLFEGYFVTFSSFNLFVLPAGELLFLKLLTSGNKCIFEFCFLYIASYHDTIP